MYIYSFYVSGSRIARCTSAMSRFAGKNFSPKPLFVGFMAISVSGYYGDFISVGTGGY